MSANLKARRDSEKIRWHILAAKRVQECRHLWQCSIVMDEKRDSSPQTALQIVDDIEGKPVKRYALAAVQAAANLIPGVGGVLSSVLASYSSESTMKRVAGLLGEIEERVTALGHTVEQLEERRQEQVMRILVESRTTLNREKLDRLRNAAVNVITCDVDDAWFGQLEDCVANLSTHDVMVLSAIYELPHNDVSRLGTGERSMEPFTAGTPMTVVRERFRDLPDDLLFATITRLERFNLLVQVDVEPSQAAPGYDYLERTTLGDRFLSLISDRTAGK